METPRKSIIAALSIRKLGSSIIISTDEDPSLRIESSAIINLRGVSTKAKQVYCIHHANVPGTYNVYYAYNINHSMTGGQATQFRF